MTIFELGAIGEFVGSFAVVFTLIYLSIQIKQNSRLMKAQNYEQRTEHLRELNTNTMNSDWYWSVLEKLSQQLPGRTNVFGHNTSASVADWRKALDTLSFEERGRYYVFSLTQWNNLQNRAFQAEQGFAEELEMWKSVATSNANMFEALGFTDLGTGVMNEVVKQSSF